MCIYVEKMSERVLIYWIIVVVFLCFNMEIMFVSLLVSMGGVAANQSVNAINS